MGEGVDIDPVALVFEATVSRGVPALHIRHDIQVGIGYGGLQFPYAEHIPIVAPFSSDGV